MKQIARGVLIVVALFSIGVGPCLASEKGFCYVVAYSFRQKVAFVTPILVQKVRGESYSDTEFCADVGLIQKLEAAFQNHVERVMRFSSPDLTVSARAAYKTQAFADERLTKEVEAFTNRGLEVKKAGSFQFKD